MPIIAHVTIPGVTKEQYDAMRAEDGWLDSPPPGGLAHLTWWQDGDCHNVDTWEDAAACDAFGQARLGPAMAKAGITSEPTITHNEPHEVLLTQARLYAPTAGRDESESSNVALVRSGYEAFGRGDIPAVLAIFGDDLRWSVPETIQFGGVYHGPQGAGEFFSKLPQLYAELNVTPEQFVAQGDTVVAIGTHRGAAKAGARFEIAFVHVWKLRGGKAIAFTESFDTIKMSAALGLAAQRTDLRVGASAG